MSKKFKHIKLWEIDNYNSSTKNLWSFSAILKYVIIILSIALILFLWKYLVRGAQITLGFLGKSTVKTVSQNLWQEMIKDEFWNVNLLLVWVGGEDHRWWYLADTIIVASWSPKEWALSMISIPRDLYVSTTWYKGRINGLFSRWYNHSGKKIWSWATNLIKKVQDIVWLEIPYYAVVDFQWFKDVIDTLWWIDIYIPNSIYDTTYPDGEHDYKTFQISAGQQILNWDTALMYARSRHTTSDFSRSQRQQKIIKEVLTTLLKEENITNIAKLKELYGTYTKMVNTNISLKEMIWMFQYIYDFEHIFSFWLTTHCSYKSYKMTDAGCFLYNWNREAYGGMAVIVPMWAKPSNISFYDYIKNFSFFVTHNQSYLIENPRIVIKNAIDKTYAYNNKKRPTWRANKMAVKLKKYGFTINNTANAEEKLQQTKVVVYWDDYDKTIETLQYFLPINNIEKGIINTWEELEHDMELILGNDFIDYIVKTPFNYEK